jgi:glycosyltransferase involved in cell wall biosynthesis
MEPADFEVIVVNDSGQALNASPWQASKHVQTVSTRCRDKSVARNTGAAMARGEYIHFLDDDDWLLPGALAAFRRATRVSDAVLLYGASRLFSRNGVPLIELHHQLEGNCFVQVMAGEWIPTGAYIVKAETFFSVGGYNPLMPVGEDVDLCRRIALHGSFASVKAVVVCAVIGAQGSTTDYDRLPAWSRRTRESILDRSGAFAWMCDSASNSYWRGRVVRAYATSAVWNIEHRRPFTAASRMVSALRGLAAGSRHLFSSAFWHAIARPYESFTFEQGFKRAAPRAQRPIASNQG